MRGDEDSKMPTRKSIKKMGDETRVYDGYMSFPQITTVEKLNMIIGRLPSDFDSLIRILKNQDILRNTKIFSIM